MRALAAIGAFFVRRWLLIAILVVLVFVLVWPGGLITSWGWGWGHRAPAASAEASLSANDVKGMIEANNEKLLENITALLATPVTTEPAAIPTEPTAVVETTMPTPENLGAVSGDDSLMIVCDFTTADAKVATRVDVQRLASEHCAWVWRAVPEAVTEAICPDNMVCTLHLSDDRKVVVEGDGKSYSIVAGTFRIASAYPLDDAVRDACRLLEKEQAFGAAEVPSFEVEAGNFSCPAK